VIFLFKVEINFRQEGWLFALTVSVWLNLEFTLIFDLFLVLDWVRVHPGKHLECLLDATEFNATLPSTLFKDRFRVWEHRHKLLEVFLLQTMSVGGLIHTGLVAFARLVIEQDLVVSKVVGCIQLEVLILVFLNETECDLALEDHVQLGEVLTLLDNGLVGDEDSTVELGDELAH